MLTDHHSELLGRVVLKSRASIPAHLKVGLTRTFEYGALPWRLPWALPTDLGLSLGCTPLLYCPHSTVGVWRVEVPLLPLQSAPCPDCPTFSTLDDRP
jgi:hypothetical protein